MNHRITIFMPLLDEGVDCWRPVEAERDGDAYVVISARPEDETWPFEPGMRLVCEIRRFADGHVGLVPTAAA